MDSTSHSTQKQIEVMRSIAPFVEEQLSLLKSVEDSWQPSDILPNMSEPDWVEKIQGFRDQSQNLSDEVLITLVGDMLTEEALPTYQTLLNRLSAFTDTTGADDTPWARWSRGWTAEENRHGDILRTYLYITGRVDMKAVDVSIQYLLRNGFDPATQDDLYRGLVYTSFQERATKVSHGNVARLAKNEGDTALATICSLITGDEARHEEAYKRFSKKILEIDPSGIILAFRALMQNVLTMPGENMTDGVDKNLFKHFSVVAQRLGVYTGEDYASIIEHLVDYWSLATLTGLSDEATQAQIYLCKLAPRYRKLAKRGRVALAKKPKTAFSWIFWREV